MLSLLLKRTNPVFNETLFETLFTESMRTSINNIIVSQRKTIEHLYDELKDHNKPLGTIMINEIAESVSFSHCYKLNYFTRYVPAFNNTVYITHTYNPYFLFQQIRDYIDEQLPVLDIFDNSSVPYRIPPTILSDEVFLKIPDFSLFIKIIESIINGTAPIDMTDTARNKNFLTTHTDISAFDKKCSSDFSFIPFQYTSNYYLRQFGYNAENYETTCLSLVSIKRKEIALTLEADGTETYETIRYFVEHFIYELKNFVSFDSEYKGYIITPYTIKTKNIRKYVHRSLLELEHLLYTNIDNEYDVLGNPIYKKIKIISIDH